MSVLCNPMNGAPPGSSVHRIFQARILEWVAISFSRDLRNPGIEPEFPALQADSLTSELQTPCAITLMRKLTWLYQKPHTILLTYLLVLKFKCCSHKENRAKEFWWISENLSINLAKNKRTNVLLVVAHYHNNAVPCHITKAKTRDKNKLYELCNRVNDYSILLDSLQNQEKTNSFTHHS